MLARNFQWKKVSVIFSFAIAVALTWGLVGCSDRIQTPQSIDSKSSPVTQPVERLSEVAPPPVIQQLSQELEAYQPQVKILNPSPDQVLQDTTVSVKFQVQDLPLFQNPELGMGPHLHVILDNQPYIPVYDLAKPLVFEDLSPGTHTLRVFASRPWHESFKNEGAYAQTTFHLFTKSADNNPALNLPLLTYSRPQGSYGAEPIMLDFYLTNAPLHLVAQQNSVDDIADWRIRATINGQSFILDRWQPIYLKGFQPGKNWVQLEFLDEQGYPVKNVFNNTVRLINYEPKNKDTLARLVTGELSAKAALGIVNPNYQPQPTPTPSPEVKPTPIPSPTVEPTPIQSVSPAVEEKPTSSLEIPAAKTITPIKTPTVDPETPAVKLATPEETPTVDPEKPAAKLATPEETPTVDPEKPATKLATPEETPTAQPAISAEIPTPATESVSNETKQTDKPKSDSILSRFLEKISGLFRNRESASSPSPELQNQVEITSPQPVVPEDQAPSANRSQPPASVEKPQAVTEPVSSEVKTPSGESAIIPDEPSLKAKLEDSEIANQPPALIDKEQPAPLADESAADQELESEKSNSGEILDITSQIPVANPPTSDSKKPPTLPEILETPFPEPLESESALRKDKQ